MAAREPANSRPVHSRHAQLSDVTRRALERSPLYSEELGIVLAKRSDAAYFCWFLASLLFGARISEMAAKNTYRSFVRHGLTSPRKILNAGWDFLVYPVMREGGYVRYDNRKSTQVLRDCETLIADYGGGPVTMNIFLRELRPFWTKADPDPLPAVGKLAKRLSIDLGRYNRKSLVFARVEAGLIRRRRELAATQSSTHRRAAY